MWICNCKTEHHLLWHETQIYDDGICYFCGYYAMKKETMGKITMVNLNTTVRKFNRKPKLQDVKERHEKITRLFEEGMSIRDIGDMMQLNSKTVSAIKNLAGSYRKYRGLL